MPFNESEIYAPTRKERNTIKRAMLLERIKRINLYWVLIWVAGLYFGAHIIVWTLKLAEII